MRKQRRGVSPGLMGVGYRMPAEWEPHAATWLAWPHNRTDWPGKFEPIPWVYAEIVRHLARVERVELIVADEAEEERARKVLSRAGALVDATDEKRLRDIGIRFHRWPTNRVWTRDFAAIFVTGDADRSSRLEASTVPSQYERSLTALNWRFNAWAKYPDWQLDNQIPGKIARRLRILEIKPTAANNPKHWVVLEGGSIDVNGAGCLLTTEECLLSEVQQRNPCLSREQLEQVFRDYLGISKVLWLERGIVGDDTHGHIDDISRFVARDTIVTAVEPDPSDPNHSLLAENLKRLRTMSDQQGKPFRVVELPMPAPVIFRGQRLPASYANFYIANQTVLVPVFNDPKDRLALNTLAELFPDRRVIGIYCGDLVWGLGTIHCMTQQQPAVNK
ncbi:MAG TPA: agmatine deiminase family protein [Terriglobales bacterium]|nr:agmatine deiminase family protein [Terriglobales bacterium]